MIRVANYPIQLGVRNNRHLALADGDDAIGQCLEHVGVQITKIARQMESGDLSIARLRTFCLALKPFKRTELKSTRVSEGTMVSPGPNDWTRDTAATIRSCSS